MTQTELSIGMANKLKALELFSGIGNFSLGLETRQQMGTIVRCPDFAAVSCICLVSAASARVPAGGRKADILCGCIPIEP